MAKKDQPTQAMAGIPKQEPRAHIAWDAKDLKPKGLDHAAMGKTVTIEMTGTVTGYRMDEYGCSIDVKPTAVTIAKSARSAEDGPSMAEQVEGMGKKYRKKGAEE